MSDDEEIFQSVMGTEEYVEEYRPGGYYPLHLNDSLLNGRYSILRKLGYGSYSTTWLARDRKVSKFVAIKVKKAKCSDTHEISMYNMLRGNNTYVIQLINHFNIHGPNGSHSCLVFPAMGPTVISLLHDHIPGSGSVLENWVRFPLPVARRILLQALNGLDYLHSRGIVHGDFHAGNWLFELQDIDKLSEKRLSQDPRNASIPVRRLEGKQSAGDPRNLTVCEPLYEWIATGANLGIKIADLGNAFPMHEKPDDPQTPIDIRSPELLLLKQTSMAQDIWSFGSLVYRFLTNIPIVSLWNMGNPEALDDSHVLQLIELLGPLPVNLKKAWSNYYEYFDKNDIQTSYTNTWCPELDFESSHTPSENNGDEGNEDGKDVDGGIEDEIHENYPKPKPDQSHILHHLVPSVVEFYKPVGLRNNDEDNDNDDEPYTPDLQLAGRFMRDKNPGMSQDEAEAALDLLQKILQYDPSTRPTTTELLRHPWIEKFCNDRTDVRRATIASASKTQHK